ncbi:MAG: FHA domain-containing protein [Polyangiaceae bacterium]|nr:FHA domain-containing protein [Polyangiaceae bacterium]
MDLEIGIACGACDTYNPMGSVRCSACDHDLSLFIKTSTSQPRMTTLRGRTAIQGAPAPEPAPVLAPVITPGLASKTAVTQSMPAVRGPRPTPTVPAPGPAPSRRPPAPDLPLAPTPELRESAEPRLRVISTSPPARKQPPSYAHLSQEELMDQAKHYLCWQCYTPVPSGHKFCGRCGAEVPAEIINARTVYFSDMQNPAKARLVLIRGEGMDGLAYHLKMEQHVVGRKGQIPFPEDVFVSPKHANFFYRDGRLVVRDEGSLNGVYLRIRGTIEVTAGDTFRAGDQVFRVEPPIKIAESQDPEGTFFYTSPKYNSAFRISQLLLGGAVGMAVCARGNSLQLGREGSDLNFPADIFMSGSHCRIEESGGRLLLTDLNSRNGTYVRIKAEHELTHGDYVFIGRKLMRVEMNV